MIDGLGRWFPDYPGQQPYMDPQYLRASHQQPQQMQQQMTPPTIRAEIVQVDGEAAARQYPVAAGASQMMMARDDSAIYVKTAAANGESVLTIYDRRAPEPPAPKFDPAAYVRKDELQTLLAALKKEAAE